MNLSKLAFKQAMRPVGRVGSWIYPNQKPLLDDLRRDDYVLIVFDALRYDVAADLLPFYLEGEIQPVWSAAHDTFQYGKRCWGDRVYTDTYISGATPIHADPDIDESFQQLYGGWNPGETLPNLVEAWRDCWDSSLGTCHPEQLVDVALEHVNESQLVVHLFQPHSPYIGRHSLLGHTDNEHADALGGEPVDKPLWDRIKDGEIRTAELQRAYRSNTLRAIEAVLPLLQTVCDQDRRVIIMADHGELLGGIHPRLVSHPRASAPQIRLVPWMKVTGVKEYPDPERVVDGTVADKLKALGYR